MNTHKLFSELDKAIRLTSSKTEQLKTNDLSLRDRIKSHFKDKGWNIPVFCRQGSYPLNTNLNPIKDGEYDLDDGVYFICPRSDRESVSTYHGRITEAVDGHAKEVIDKNTCVRVVYADGHHIDLPCYWMEQDGDTPELAHKSKEFIKSDPKEFKSWVDSKISQSNSNGQLRRMIRYFKAWMDYRENCNSSLNLASGFIWTILVCENFVKSDRDDSAFKDVAEAIKNKLDANFSCYRPTTPQHEDLLEGYSKDSLLKELANLVKNAQDAIDAESEEESADCWRKIFGDRFPKGEKPKTGGKTKTSAVVAPPVVAATKPYYEPSNAKHAMTMEITNDLMSKVHECFPKLHHSPERSEITGTMSFCSKYEMKKNGLGNVVPAKPDDPDSFSGEYRIRIDLPSTGIPKVFETSGKISEVAQRLGMKQIDLHVFPDGSCCLDYITTMMPANLDIYQFITNKVYPFLAWQAYFDKYEMCPPCGEHSHNPAEALNELKADIRNLGRNDLCFCGSGKKFKRCCLGKM